MMVVSKLRVDMMALVALLVIQDDAPRDRHVLDQDEDDDCERRDDEAYWSGNAFVALVKATPRPRKGSMVYLCQMRWMYVHPWNEHPPCGHLLQGYLLYVHGKFEDRMVEGVGMHFHQTHDRD